jgi:hypothetical protein
VIAKLCIPTTGAVSAITGMVSIWTLAGFVGVAVYRNNQIASHPCLSQLPLPASSFHSGLVALAVSIGSGVLTILLSRSNRLRRTVVWLLVVFGIVAAPILVVSITSYVTAQPTDSMSPTACVGGDDGPFEEDR